MRLLVNNIHENILRWLKVEETHAYHAIRETFFALMLHFFAFVLHILHSFFSLSESSNCFVYIIKSENV